MLYKVPQKINLEDKVIGPLTFRQFLYLLAGGVPSFVIAKILEKLGLSFALGIFLTFPIWLPAIFLSFGKFQEQNIDQILVAFLSFVRSPKVFVWRVGVYTPKVKILAKKKKKHAFSAPKSLKSRLQNLHEEIAIYGLKQQEAQERIVAQRQNLKIKTKIKPLTELPKSEQQKLPSALLETSEQSPQTSSSPKKQGK